LFPFIKFLGRDFCRNTFLLRVLYLLCFYNFHEYIFWLSKLLYDFKAYSIFFSFGFLVSEEQLIEFVENKDYTILLNALKNFKDEEEIVLHVLHCLHSLAIPCKYPDFFFSCEKSQYISFLNILWKYFLLFRDLWMLNSIHLINLYILGLYYSWL
jgi:hypothetical protein